MKIKFPKYYSAFACVKGDCPDSCCVGWDIGIDEATRIKYENLQGDIGERARKETYLSEDGCTYLKMKGDGKCPFLNLDGLCELIIEKGDSLLSDICKRHPRYLTRVDGITEGGIGLCCPPAAELILGSSEKEYFTKSFLLPYEVENTVGMLSLKLERKLIKLRNGILKSVIKADTGAAFATSSVLDNAELLIRYIDFDQDPDIPCEEPPTPRERFAEALGEVCGDFLEKLSECELLSDDYGKELIEAARFVRENGKAFGEYLEGVFAPYLKRLLYYFIHRYFLAGLPDCSVGVRMKLSAVYALEVGAICFYKGASSLSDIAIIAKDFSKNIEYSEENTEKNIRDTYAYVTFTYENLKSMFE